MSFMLSQYANRSVLLSRYWQTFDPYVKPLLAQEMDLRRFNELDTSIPVMVVQNATLWEEVREYQEESN